jgi:hypothetical protein
MVLSSQPTAAQQKSLVFFLALNTLSMSDEDISITEASAGKRSSLYVAIATFSGSSVAAFDTFFQGNVSGLCDNLEQQSRMVAALGSIIQEILPPYPDVPYSSTTVPVSSGTAQATTPTTSEPMVSANPQGSDAALNQASGFSSGAIAGLVVLGILLLIAIILILLLAFRLRRSPTREPQNIVSGRGAAATGFNFAPTPQSAVPTSAPVALLAAKPDTFVSSSSRSESDVDSGSASDEGSEDDSSQDSGDESSQDSEEEDYDESTRSGSSVETTRISDSS